jgi:hypothetical protein
MTAQDYLTALKVIREIQRKQSFATGRSDLSLVKALQYIELYCPLDLFKSGGRLIKDKMLDSYTGNLFSI